jgi:hypothetical protein
MTQTHPITPPPELGASLRNSAPHQLQDRLRPARELWLINHAYAAGADQELEACAEWVNTWCTSRYLGDAISADVLRAARRPKPQTLNSVALQMLGTIERDAHYIPEITDTIRRALEALND